jgi:two-component system LytT family response regulator
MRVLRAVIADDEPTARRRLRRLLEAEPDVSIVGEASTGAEAAALLHAHRPDALFLDIQMPGLDGFQVIEALGDLNETSVIFVTAYDEYAVRAFEVQALDYLLKPITAERLRAALERLRERQPAEARSRPYWKRILVDGARRAHLVNVEDIDWIESDRNYVVLHCGDQEHVVRATLTAFLGRLNPDDFSRISRSAAVNLNRVGEMQPRSNGDYVVRLSSGRSLNWSRRYMREVAL